MRACVKSTGFSWIPSSRSFGHAAPATTRALSASFSVADSGRTSFASGGGIQFGGKTSGGTPLKLRLGVGRDTAGGGAGFINLQIGPDFAPMTPPR